MTSDTPTPMTAHKLPSISFEFFPPKTEEMERGLWEAIERLAPLAPRFVSVTYGAGGSTRERTHATIARILAETDLTPAAHLTCVAASRGDVDEVVARYHAIGVRHIVALRGDPPGGIGTRYQAHPDGYQTSAALVAAISASTRHGSHRLAYPEKIRRAQLDAPRRAEGPRSTPARRANHPVLLRQRSSTSLHRPRPPPASHPDRAGLLPVQNFKLAKNSPRAPAPACRTGRREVRGLDDDAETRKLVAATYSADRCAAQLAGVDCFHFYTVPPSCVRHQPLLGLRPHRAQQAA